MRNQLDFQLGVRRIKPADLHPGRRREIAFVECFAYMVIRLHGFDIRRIKVFFYHVLECGAIMFQRIFQGRVNIPHPFRGYIPGNCT